MPLISEKKAGMRVGDPRHIPVRTPVVMAVAKAFPHNPDLFEQDRATAVSTFSGGN